MHTLGTYCVWGCVQIREPDSSPMGWDYCLIFQMRKTEQFINTTNIRLCLKGTSLPSVSLLNAGEVYSSKVRVGAHSMCLEPPLHTAPQLPKLIILLVLLQGSALGPGDLDRRVA